MCDAAAAAQCKVTKKGGNRTSILHFADSSRLLPRWLWCAKCAGHVAKKDATKKEREREVGHNCYNSENYYDDDDSAALDDTENLRYFG